MERKLTELVSRLQEAAGKNLESVILHGSAARGDYRPGSSDLNVLCTLVTMDVNELQRLSPVVKWWTHEMHEPAPLFFLTEELRRSTDVFAIESLDIQRSHKVLFGENVVKDLEIPMNLHRVEVEHELRMLLLRLRQHVIHAGHNEMEMGKALKKSFSGTMTLLRHTLLAFGEEPPASAVQVFERIEGVTGASAKAFQGVHAYREVGSVEEDLFHTYDHYLRALEKVIVALDGILPKKEWKRVQE